MCRHMVCMIINILMQSSLSLKVYKPINVYALVCMIVWYMLVTFMYLNEYARICECVCIFVSVCEHTHLIYVHIMHIHIQYPK